jgi:hypothetical protein
MKRFLLLASLAAVAVGGVAAIPADAGAAKVKCKGKVKLNKPGGKKGKVKVKCPRNKLRGPAGPAGPQGPQGEPGTGTGGGANALRFDSIGSSLETVIATAQGLEIQAECLGDEFTSDTEIQSVENNGALHLSQFDEDDASPDIDYDPDFDDGDSENIESNDDDNNSRFEFRSRGGTVIVTGQLGAGDGTNGGPQGSDCSLWGSYNVV